MALDLAATKTQIADYFETLGTHAALYTSWAAGSAGTEVSGGSPAYARKPITWTNGSAGITTGTVTFDVPPSTTAVAVGLYDALTAGNYKAGASITSFTSTGQTTLTVTLTFTQS